MCVYMYKCLASKVAENAFEAFLRIKKRKSNRDLTKKSESWERKIKYMEHLFRYVSSIKGRE